MKRAKEITLAAGLLTLLAGCSQATTIPHSYIRDSYHPAHLGYIAGRGGMMTQVVGNPFDAPQPAVEAAVTESMQASHFGPQMPFFTEPPAGYKPSSYRTVVLFNPAPGAAPARLCQQPDQPQDPRSGRVGVLAAFCNGPIRVTSAGGSIGAAEGPDDPAFRSLLRQIALLLYPPQPGDMRGNDRDAFQAN